MDLPLKGSRDHRQLHDSDDKKYLLKNYLQNGHVHGLKYLGRKNKCETFFWSIILVAFAIAAGYFIVLEFSTQSNRMMTTKSLPKPIQTLPFPAITICPETKAQKTVLSFTEAYQTYHKNDSNASLSDRQKEQIEALSQVCDPHLFESTKINENPTPGENLHGILRGVTITPDVLLFCKFQQELINCTELFKEILTDDGICYTFNGLDHSKHSEHGNETVDQLLKILPGAHTGLNVVLYTKGSDLDFICKGPVQGYKVKVHSPHEHPRMSSGYTRIPLNSETLVNVKPQVAVTEPDDGALCHSSQTKTLIHFREYSQQNCRSECFSQFVLKQCGCVKFTMVHGENERICTQHETKCVSEAEKAYDNYTIMTGVPCDCLPDCNSLKFDTRVSEAAFDFKKVFSSYEASLEEFPAAILSRLSVYVEDTFYTVEHLTIQNTMLDTIAKIGGIAAFFLGASLVSFIEVFFYLFRRFLC